MLHAEAAKIGQEAACLSKQNHTAKIKNKSKKIDCENKESEHHFQEMKMQHDLTCGMKDQVKIKSKTNRVDLRVQNTII